MRSDGYLLRDTGRVVRHHRTHAGLTRERLAEYSGVSVPAIYRIETGAASPQLDTVIKLLDVLNVTVRFDSPLLREERARGESR